eukprot:gene14507-19196_t
MTARDRLYRLSSVSPSDRRISLGCINVSEAFYDSYIRPTFDASSAVVYILPEARALNDVFAMPAASTRAVDDADGASCATNGRFLRSISGHPLVRRSNPSQHVCQHKERRLAKRRAFDEIMGQADSTVARPELAALGRWIDETPNSELRRRQQSAEATFRQLGITFAVYGDSDASERIIPFDIVPRVFLASEWARLSEGLVQRVEAINAFLDDIYGARRILDEGVLPPDLIFGNAQFRPEIAGIRPPHGIWAHICGIDLVRTGPNDFF